jgi:hypothetical protein
MASNQDEDYKCLASTKGRKEQKMVNAYLQ